MRALAGGLLYSRRPLGCLLLWVCLLHSLPFPPRLLDHTGGASSIPCQSRLRLPALPCLALPCPARLTVPRLASACCAGKGSPAVTRSVRITRHATSAVTACMVPRPGYADRS